MFLDTTVLVDILRGDRKVLNYVEEIAKKEHLLFSIVQIGELADWCHGNNLDPLKVTSDVKSIATVVNITERICLDGSKIKQKQREDGKGKFSLIDGLIVASAVNSEQMLFTRDRDFEGLEKVVII